MSDETFDKCMNVLILVITTLVIVILFMLPIVMILDVKGFR